jgi:hypothetical protein
MAEKHLGDGAWKSLAGKNKLKDLGLGAALAAYAKLGTAGDPAERLDALDQITTLAVRLGKAKDVSGNEAIADFLDEMQRAAAKERAAVQAFAKRQSKEADDAVAPQDEDPDDDETGDLAARLTKGLQRVRTGQGKVSLAFLACVANPTYGLLVAKRVTPKDKQLLTEATGGRKFVTGTCTFETGKLTFVMETVKAGLAKQIQKTIKAATAKNLPVRIRDVEGTASIDDETDVETPDDAAETPPVPQTAGGRPVAALKARLDEIVAGIKTASAAKNPKLAEALRAATVAATEASALLKRNDAAGAERALARAGELLEKAKSEALAPSNDAPPQRPDAEGGKKYEGAKAKATEELGKIEKAVADLTALKHADAAKYADALKRLRAKFDEAETLSTTDETAAKAKMQAVITSSITNRVASEALVAKTKGSDSTAAAGANANLKRWGEDKLAALKLKATAIGAEIAAIEPKIARIKELIARRLYKAADNLSGEVFWDCDAASKIADAHAAYAAARVAADQALAALRTKPRKELVEKETGEVDKKLAAAAALADLGKREFDAALAALKEAAAATQAAANVLTRTTSFEVARDALIQKVTALEGRPQAATIKTRTDAVRALVAQAQTLADARDFDGADGLLAKGGATVDAETKVEASQAKVVGERDAAQTSIDAVGTDSAKALKAVRALLAPLQSHVMTKVVRDEILTVEKNVKGAEAALKAKDPDEAKRLLAAAADGCVAANAKLRRMVDFDSTLKQASSRVTKLESTKDKEAMAKGKEIRASKIAPAEKAAADGNVDAAYALLAAVDGEAAAAEKTAAAHARYVKANDALTPRVKALSAHKQTKAAKTELDAAKAKIVAAAAKAETGDFAGAADLADEAAELLDQGVALADLAAGKAPTGDAIRKIGKGKDGAQALDKVVAAMGDKPNGRLMVAAIEARFDKKFTSKEVVGGTKGAQQEGEELKRIYSLMQKVPDTHTKDNPKLKKIENTTGPAGSSFYRGSEGLVAIAAGRPGKHLTVLGKPDEVPDAEEDCKPLPDDPTSPLKYFDWTTLHEVGHAVDDKAGFMTKNGSAAAYGGWTDHGSNFMPAVEAAFKRFEYDKDYIQDVVGGAAPPPAPPPTGSDAVDPVVWEKRRTDFEEWYANVRCSTDNGPIVVGDGAAAKAAAIDGRVVQESYPGKWTSYDVASRTKGLTGYQFRAPAEFFAELYAGYHTGKLKPAHPAVPWLSTL